MGFDFKNASGEAFGDIEEVFFKKNGKSLLEEQNNLNNQTTENTKVDLNDLTKSIAKKSEQLTRELNSTSSFGGTVINISADIINEENDMKIVLTEQEERRMNTSTIRNKKFVDINTGEIVVIIEKSKLFNGSSLFNVKHEDGRIITYPISMFVGRKKQFVPKDFYIREAERAIESSIDKETHKIYNMIIENKNLEETSDGIYLELILDEPIKIIGDIRVPDKVQIPVKKMFDLNYKILMLENVICLDNRIASLLFNDIWF